MAAAIENGFAKKYPAFVRNWIWKSTKGRTFFSFFSWKRVEIFFLLQNLLNFAQDDVRHAKVVTLNLCVPFFLKCIFFKVAKKILNIFGNKSYAHIPPFIRNVTARSCDPTSGWPYWEIFRQIFAQWGIVCFGQIHENYWSSPHFWATLFNS
jgi:hypothetical protein